MPKTFMASVEIPPFEFRSSISKFPNPQHAGCMSLSMSLWNFIRSQSGEGTDHLPTSDDLLRRVSGFGFRVYDSGFKV